LIFAGKWWEMKEKNREKIVEKKSKKVLDKLEILVYNKPRR